jgi:hypothetical protein
MKEQFQARMFALPFVAFAEMNAQHTRLKLFFHD